MSRDPITPKQPNPLSPEPLSDLGTLVNIIVEVTNDLYKWRKKWSDRNVPMQSQNIGIYRKILELAEEESDAGVIVAGDISYILDQFLQATPVREAMELVQDLAVHTRELTKATKIVAEKFVNLRNILNARVEEFDTRRWLGLQELMVNCLPWLFGVSDETTKDISETLRHLQTRVKDATLIVQQHVEYWSRFNDLIGGSHNRSLQGTMNTQEILKYREGWCKVKEDYMYYGSQVRLTRQILELPNDIRNRAPPAYRRSTSPSTSPRRMMFMEPRTAGNARL